MNSDTDNERTDNGGLGSLTQQARKGQLKQARGILFFIGIISLLANLFLYANAESEVRQEVDKQLAGIGGRQT